MAGELIVPAIDVYDADTIEVRITLPPPLNDVRIRLLGIDSPEVPAKSYVVTGKLGRAKCIKEAELALDARDFIRTKVKAGGNKLYLENYKWDKYGGRIDADVFVLDPTTDKKINLAETLIDLKYAIPYFGGTRTHDWCVDLIE